MTKAMLKSGRKQQAASARVIDLRSRRSEQSQQQILAAAEAEFADKGLAGARVDAIAEASGINKQMIYYYYGSKDDLYLAVL
jgi:TetR/AcrR family transcriptional regulator